MRQPELLSA